MRRKVNVVTTTLFVLCAFAAVYFGWIDDEAAAAGKTRTWPICLALVAVTLLIGIIRFALLYKAYKEEKEEFIPVRSVTFEDAVVVENGVEKEDDDKVALVHVDTVAEDKVVVRVFKDSVALPDCAGKVNK